MNPEPTVAAQILAVIWFLLPAGAGNMAPVFAARLLPAWQWPVDCGVTVRNRRLFGSHKTWRGIVAGLAAASAVFLLQRELYEQHGWARAISWIDYAVLPWWLGTAMGGAALGGDLLKSFAKRQVGVAPGRPWPPFDQIDWLLGLAVLAMVIAPVRLDRLLLLLAVGVVLHLASKVIGHLIRLHREWI